FRQTALEFKSAVALLQHSWGNSRRRHLFQSERFEYYVRDSPSIGGKSKSLRSAIVADARVRTLSRLQPFGSLERDHVSLRARARHIQRDAADIAAARCATRRR